MALEPPLRWGDEALMSPPFISCTLIGYRRCISSWHICILPLFRTQRKGLKMARNFKTPKKARTTYKVYDAYDRVVAEFMPGQDGVTEVLIQQLHAADDDEYDANRRKVYHIPVHYMAYTSGDAEEAEDRNSYLADEAADPSIIFEKAFSRAEFKREFRERWNRLSKEQQWLVIRKANGETNVSIAAEQGVSEAAIRNQLKRIQKHFMDIH